MSEESAETSRWEVNFLAIVEDSKRKNAFSHRLKDKPKQSPEMEPGMTADEVKVAEKNLDDAEKASREASRCL